MSKGTFLGDYSPAGWVYNAFAGAGDDTPQQQAYSQYYNDIKNVNTQVPNRFENYQPEYSTIELLGNYDRYLKSGYDTLRGDTQNQIGQATKANTSRLASQGITGGSILNNSNAGIGYNIGNAGTTALNQLTQQGMKDKLGIMNQGNQNKLDVTGKAQNVDFSNIEALLRKYGAQGSAIGGLKNTNGSDDLLSLIKTGSSFLPFL